MIFINTLKKTLSNYCDNNSMYMVFDICESVVDIIIIVIVQSTNHYVSKRSCGDIFFEFTNERIIFYYISIILFIYIIFNAYSFVQKHFLKTDGL